MIIRYAALLMCSIPLTLCGQTQNALDFDGVNDEVTVTNASALIANATGFSMTCWVYPTNPTSNFPNMEGFAGFRDNLGCDFYLLQTYGTSLEARFRSSSNVVYTIDSASLLTLNTWQFLALTYDGASLSLYRDGMLIGSVAATGTLTNVTKAFHIGNVPYQTGTDFWLDGKVDEVGLWKRSLTNAELLCIQGYGADPADADLKLYYKMDQGVAGGPNPGLTTLINAKTGNNGILQGLALSGTSSNYVDGCPIAGTVTETICPGETVIFNGQPYSTAGTFTAAYPLTNGCDSLATLTVKVTSVNTNVIQSGNNLVSQATNAQYQWLDCGIGYAEIAGATAPSFQVTTAGSFAVEVTQNGCTDTSSCVSNVGIGELEQFGSLAVYHDASAAQLVLEGGGSFADLRMTLLDARGRAVAAALVRGDRSMLPVGALPSGFYVLHVAVGSGQRTFRIAILN